MLKRLEFENVQRSMIEESWQEVSATL